MVIHYCDFCMSTLQPALEGKVLDFLREHKTMVLTCMSETNVPYCLPLTYAVDTEMTLYFTTPKPSRKYSHMKLNNKVSLVVYEDNMVPTSVTIEGEVNEIDDPEEARYVLTQVVNRVWQESPFVPTSFRLKKETLTVMRIRPQKVTWFQDRIMDSVIENESLVL